MIHWAINNRVDTLFAFGEDVKDWMRGGIVPARAGGVFGDRGWENSTAHGRILSEEYGT